MHNKYKAKKHFYEDVFEKLCQQSIFFHAPTKTQQKYSIQNCSREKYFIFEIRCFMRLAYIRPAA
jgi:hypothetical protein